MIGQSNIQSRLTLAMILILSPLFAMARGSDVSFRASVTGIQQSSGGEATVSFRVEGFVLSVRVTAETDIEIHGEKLRVAEVQVGDFAKVAGFFSASGIVARDIEILDRGKGEFRLRGTVTDVRGTAQGIMITVLGVPVLLDSGTVTGSRGTGAGAPLSALVPGMEVDVRGVFREPTLVATRLTIGDRQKDGNEVKFEGNIQSISGVRIAVDTQGGGAAIVVLTGATVVKGTLAVGSRVEVKGFLNDRLEVEAHTIKVEGVDDNRGDDRGRDDEAVLFARRIPLARQIAGSRIEGEAEVELQKESSKLEQEFEVEIEDADLNSGYQVLVTLTSSRTIDFGILATDSRGKGKMKFSTEPKEDERDLRPFLSSGEDVRQFALVRVLKGSVTVLEGRFQ